MPPDLAHVGDFLFIPADRPERFEKAVASGADAIILDLEDAVAPKAKNQALEAAAARLAAGGQAILRVNAPGTPWAEDETLADSPGVLAVMRPKAEADEALVRLTPRKPGIALTETASGVAEAGKVASLPGVLRLALGAVDLCLDLGIGETPEILLPIRLGLAIASEYCSLPPPIDGVTVELRHASVIHAAVRRARDPGFGGKRRRDRLGRAGPRSRGCLRRRRGFLQVDRLVNERAKQILACARTGKEEH